MNAYIIKEYGHDDDNHQYIVFHHSDDTMVYEGDNIVETGVTYYDDSNNSIHSSDLLDIGNRYFT